MTDLNELWKGVSEDNIALHISALAEIGSGEGEGISRLAYSEAEAQAFSYFVGQASANGLVFREDANGNLFVGLAGRQSNKKKVLFGSHVDSVYNGGNYDGAAGVVAGFEAMRAFNEGAEMDVEPQLVIWRGEESSRFNQAYLGSLAAFGKLPLDLKDRTDRDGQTLGEILREAKLSQHFLFSGGVSLDAVDIDSYFELHIEQGRVLEEKGKEIGIVTSIRAASRLEVEIIGKYDHSGATPMDMRQDAVRAAVSILNDIEEEWLSARDNGHDIVYAPTMIHTDPVNDSINKISGYCKFYLDIRSNDLQMRDLFEERVRTFIEYRRSEYNVTSNITALSQDEPVKSLDASMMDKIEGSAIRLNHSYMRMPSGAGHDAAVVAKAGIPTAMIFIPCKNGISHSPAEYTSSSDIKRGTQVLVDTIAHMV